jgi:hypothetical protein
MEKFGHLPKEPLPLEMLLKRITQDLFIVFAGNGYKQIGFTLIAQDLRTNEMAMAGNLMPKGAEAILTNALESVKEALHAANDVAQDPKPAG